MAKSQNSSIPGVNVMTDTFDFFKNMWSNVPGMNLPGMNIPSMVMPSLSVEEVDKQIKDLKAVETWLALNMNMLQGTIQALEVQRATLSTLQTMGESISAAMQAPPPSVAPERSAFESPFAAPKAKPESKPEAKKPEPQEPAAAPAAAPDMPGIPPMANPAAWWNMLQDQFKQAVDTAAAMTPETPAAAPAAEDKPAAPRKRKAAPKD